MIAASANHEVSARDSAPPEGDDARVVQQNDQASPVSASSPRRRGNPAFLPNAGPGRLNAHFLIAREWLFMVPVMALSLLVSAIVQQSWPPALTFLLTLAAIGLVCATPKFVTFERTPNRSLIARYIAAIIVVMVPMELFGFAIAQWIGLGDLDPSIGVSVLVISGAVVAISQTSRLASLAAGLIALWSGMCLVFPSLPSILALLVGCGIGGLSALLQARRDRKIDERQREFERVQVRAERLLAEYEQTGLGWFWETDRRGAIAYLSPPICRLLGLTSADLIGRPFTDLFILDEGNRERERTLTFHLLARSSFQDIAARAAAPGTEERWWSVSGRPIHDSYNNFVGFRGSGSDLTEKKRAQESETRLAHYDSLTSLANRFQMSQTLEQILNAQREELRACSVFLLDLDRFKQVNDTMGHPAGDALLRQVAIRLENTVDKFGRVGRLGGDEFKVVLPGRHQREDLANLAQRIIENLSQPYFIDGSNVVIGVSIGIALAPDDGVTSEALIRNADLALYAAKDGGRGRHHFYASDLHADAEERRQLEEDLRDALQRGGLELFYQPVVSTSSEKITGFEALLRWDHPQHGYLSPAKFVPIAEDAGMIAAIGEWALRTACQDLANWPEEVRVAVNVSPLQFANPSLPAIVTNALAAAQIAPERLELEITESVFLNDDSGTDAMFAALKRVGVRLALDDFGTGFSSLGYLKKAPFDKIKIDQSFVRGATMKDSRNGAIIASIVSLAEALGMETTAEGVETLDELELMRILGCSHIQGFIYEKPLNTAAATDRLRNGLRAIAQGPRSARAVRQTTLRKAVLEHGGQQYHGTIRNISASGAMIEGLWNVPAGTVFTVQIAGGQRVEGTARWCNEGRLGIEFNGPVDLAADSPVRASAVRRVAETQQQRLQA